MKSSFLAMLAFAATIAAPVFARAIPETLDVAARQILAPTGTIDSGTTLTPKAVVQNLGDTTATFPVWMTIKGGGTSYSNSQTVSSLPPSSFDTVSFSSWTAGPRGSYAARCSTALIGDQNHANDTVSNSFTVQVLDVEPILITQPTGTVDSNATIAPRVEVVNLGSVAASFLTRFQIGSVYVDSVEFNSLGSGDTGTIQFHNWTAGQRGPYATKCSTELIGDQHPENDKINGSVTVRVTDVGVRSIAQPAGTVDSGSSVAPEAWVKNYGTDSVSFPVLFTIGSVYAQTSNVTNLSPSDSDLVSFTSWTAGPRGTYITRCSTGLASDQNRMNDTMSGSVTVQVLDVEPILITQPIGNVDSNAIIPPRVEIVNLGSSTASFLTRFQIGSVYVDSVEFNSLGSGDTGTIQFHDWTADQRGTYATKCSTELVGDQHPENNKKSDSVTVQVMDMTCLRIIAPSGAVDSGQVVTPQAWVKNLGSSAASCSVAFRVGSSYVKQHHDSSLAPGDSALDSFPTWTANPRGTYAVSCSTELAGDQHPGNDQQTGTVIVGVADMTCLRIVAPSGAVDSGQVVTPQAWVKNLGSSAASCSVAFRISSGYLKRRYVTSSASGDSALDSFPTWTAGPRGTYAVSCSTELAGDQHPENDKQTGMVVVGVLDMTCLGIVAPGDTVDSGQVVTPLAWVKNLGSPAVSCSVAFRIGTGYLRRHYVASLATGDSALDSFPAWTAGPRGAYPFSCSTELAGDQHPENDEQSGTVAVIVADMTCLRIIAPSDTIASGQMVAPQAWVKNLGSSAASCSVAFRIGGDYSNRHYVNGLIAGDSSRLSFLNWMADSAGTYAISCSTELADDQCPANDQQTGTVVVASSWKPTADIPAGSSGRSLGSGSCITCLTGTYSAGAIYVLKGNNTCEFLSRDENDTWRTLASVPLVDSAGQSRRVRYGGTLAAAGGSLYATKGNHSLDFWMFQPASDTGKWTQLADVPAGQHRVCDGASAAALADGSTNYIYLLKGSHTREFYRYDVAGGEWEQLPSVPSGPSGRDCCIGSVVVDCPDEDRDGARSLSIRGIYALKGWANEFFRYDPTSDSWSSLAPLPLDGRCGRRRRAGAGAAAAYYNRKIYVLKGGLTLELWVYDIDQDTWIQAPDLPQGSGARVGAGGSLCVVGDSLFATKGHNTLDVYECSLNDLALATGTSTLVGGDAQMTTLARAPAIRVFPNPSAGATRLRYSLLRPGRVVLRLFDASGRAVALLMDGWALAGDHELVINDGARGRGLAPGRLSAGVYLVRAEINGKPLSTKFVVR
jgi:hypothetical protein